MKLYLLYSIITVILVVISVAWLTFGSFISMSLGNGYIGVYHSGGVFIFEVVLCLGGTWPLVVYLSRKYSIVLKLGQIKKYTEETAENWMA